MPTETSTSLKTGVDLRTASWPADLLGELGIAPGLLPEVVLPEGEEVWIVDLITRAGFAGTNGEARRLIRGGGVRLEGEQVKDETLSLQAADLSGQTLQVGKRRYARIVS